MTGEPWSTDQRASRLSGDSAQASSLAIMMISSMIWPLISQSFEMRNMNRPPCVGIFGWQSGCSRRTGIQPDEYSDALRRFTMLYRPTPGAGRFGPVNQRRGGGGIVGAGPLPAAPSQSTNPWNCGEVA